MAASSVSADASAFRTVQPLEYYLKFLTQGVRPDGRALLRARKATSRGGAVSSADGSCMVQLGKTVVIAGVQCEPSVLYPRSVTPGTLPGSGAGPWWVSASG